MQDNLNMEVIKDDFNKLVGLYSQIEGINEEIKMLKESIKNEGCNPAIVAKIAQAVVKDKKEDIVEQATDLIDLVTAITE